MDFLLDLAGWSTLAVAAILLIVQLLAHVIGYRFGAGRRTTIPEQAENVGVVVSPACSASWLSSWR